MRSRLTTHSLLLKRLTGGGALDGVPHYSISLLLVGGLIMTYAHKVVISWPTGTALLYNQFHNWFEQNVIGSGHKALGVWNHLLDGNEVEVIAASLHPEHRDLIRGVAGLEYKCGKPATHQDILCQIEQEYGSLITDPDERALRKERAKLIASYWCQCVTPDMDTRSIHEFFDMAMADERIKTMGWSKRLVRSIHDVTTSLPF